MNESVYRRLCLTSVCGAILIPATMALVSAVADPAGSTAVVASAAATAPAGGTPVRRGVSDGPSPDRITQERGDTP